MSGNAAKNFDYENEDLGHKGFSLTVAEGEKYDVKLRTAHASDEILGISIRIHKKEKTTLEQYDINPDLSTVDRREVKMKLIDVFKVLSSSKSISQGFSNLQTLEDSGRCFRWKADKS